MEMLKSNHSRQQLSHRARQQLLALQQQPATVVRDVATKSIPRTAASTVRLLAPILRAYGLAYFSLTSIQLIRVVMAVVRKKRDPNSAIWKAMAIINQGVSTDAFPFLAGSLVAASTAGPRLVTELYYLLKGTPKSEKTLPHPVLRFAMVFATSMRVFWTLNKPGRSQMLQTTHKAAHYAETASEQQSGKFFRLPTSKPPSLTGVKLEGGKTLFITSFGITNAVIVAANLFLEKAKANNNVRVTSLWKRFGGYTVPVSFSLSCAVIMWLFVYNPEKLPKEYRDWINTGASMDDRLMDSIRKAHTKELQYGEDTGVECYLGSLAKELGLPEEMGDPRRVNPIPCELCHAGTGKSCEKHAAVRALRTWLFAMRLYIPLNAVALLTRKPDVVLARKALVSSMQSSAFLGSYALLFFYSFCLVRTRIGPHIVGKSIPARNFLDGGIAIGAGCAACGWSILLERPGRRSEMALFVAPRAMSSLLPTTYREKFMWREQVAFAASAATILTAAATSKKSGIQGVFGRMLSQVYA